MTLGVENRGKITQNRSKGRSGSENGESFCKNAEVQKTLCFASPNGSPHDPESTKIGRGGSKIDQKLLTHAKKTRAKKHEKNGEENLKDGARCSDMVRVGGRGAARQGGGI